MPPFPPPIGDAGLQDWIGRSQTADDTVSPRLEASLRAVLDKPPGSPREGDAATPTIHWCLAPAIAPMSELGRDGHPERGDFLPPVALPRRMWAGGELLFHDPLKVGDVVTRVSTIRDVVFKEGRSGPLCFVTVNHAFSTARGLAITERQDIVYREMTSAETPAPGGTGPQADQQRPWICDPVMMFRYSALTFNGHRIHYDRDYARLIEGYPELVVHGPLQAQALLAFATEVRGSAPASFTFRGVSPLFASTPATLNCAAEEDGLALWIRGEAGRTTMKALARWA